MENPVRTIIVPWDFTEKAEFAFAHACNVIKVTNSSITLLHIVKEETDVAPAKEKLIEAGGILQQKYGVKPESAVVRGNIFKSIGEAAHTFNAELVIMGTHGIRGMQKLTGSWALKVIVKSKVPFVVVQEPPRSGTFKNVVFPVNYKRESKEKIKWSGFLSRYYNSKFFIFAQNKDDKGLKKKLAVNIHFTKKFLDNNRMQYEIVYAPGKSDFAKETVEYAEKIQADLILVITSRALFFTDYMLGSSEQYILANPSKIPVMCVNPRPSKFSGGFSATGG